MSKQFYLDKKVASGFILSLIVLVVLAFFFFQSMRRLMQTSRLLSHGLSVIGQVNQVEKAAIDIETSRRGYVITGDESFLDPFHKSRKDIEAHFAKLDSLTVLDTLQAARVDSLKQLIAKTDSFSTAVINLRSEGFEGARDLIIAGNGKKFTDSIRSLVKRMQDQEGRSFRAKNTITSSSLEQFMVSFVALAASIAVIIVTLFYAINRSYRRRNIIEHDLSQNLAEKQDLYDNAPCGYFSYDQNQAIVSMNRTMLSWLGYTDLATMTGKTVSAVVTTGWKSVAETPDTTGIADFDVELVRSDGTTFPAIVSIRKDGNELHRASVVENSERKRQQDQIRKMNQELEQKVKERTDELSKSVKIHKSIAATIPGSAVIVFDTESNYVLAEGELLISMGYDKTTLVGRNLTDVVPPDRLQLYRELLADACNGQSISREIVTMSGAQTMLKVAPLHDEHENIFGVLLVLIDISEIKAVQSRLEELNESLEAKVNERTTQLLKVNKDLEAFTYSVSHDLRAPLRAVNGYARILEEDYNSVLDSEGLRFLKLIAKNGIRMSHLIDDLLEFSRVGRKDLVKSDIDMTRLVNEVMKEQSEFEGERIIHVKTGSLANAHGDSNMLRQVWQNLISNALKYSQHRHETNIEIGCYDEGDFTCYYIKDNGAGFDMTYASKLFGVFQRLHKVEEFEGTGVGLAIIKTIVDKHGGRAWADATVNQGATFYFTLPKSAQPSGKSN